MEYPSIYSYSDRSNAINKAKELADIFAADFYVIAHQGCWKVYHSKDPRFAIHQPATYSVISQAEGKIDAKLHRGEQFAAMQRYLTMKEAAERGAGWTAEDAAILMPMNIGLRRCWDRYDPRNRFNDYRAHRNYRENLNA